MQNKCPTGTSCFIQRLMSCTGAVHCVLDCQVGLMNVVILCQSSTPLVRFETLSLMQLVLKRATAVIEHFGAQETSTFKGEYLQLCTVLLILPLFGHDYPICALCCGVQEWNILILVCVLSDMTC